MQLSSQPDSEALPFLRRRVASFGLFAGGFTLLFWGFRALNMPAEGLHDRDSLTHLAASAVLLLVWPALRFGKDSPTYVRAVESAGLLISCGLFVIMGMSLERGLERREHIMVLALTFVTCSRAVYVPSSGTRTAILSGLIGVALLLGVYYGYVDLDVAPYAKFDPRLAGVPVEEIARGLTMGTAMWWALSSGLAFATSRVIYGLRKQVSQVKQLGQYRLDRKIGAGGMGVVYEAHHAMLRRPTAIKLLPPGKSGEAALLRFEREVKLTSLLRHPNTITIYDYGRTPDGIFYYAMELLDGATLQQVIDADGPVPVSWRSAASRCTKRRSVLPSAWASRYLPLSKTCCCSVWRSPQWTGQPTPPSSETYSKSAHYRVGIKARPRAGGGITRRSLRVCQMPRTATVAEVFAATPPLPTPRPSEPFGDRACSPTALQPAG